MTTLRTLAEVEAQTAALYFFDAGFGISFVHLVPSTARVETDAAGRVSIYADIYVQRMDPKAPTWPARGENGQGWWDRVEYCFRTLDPAKPADACAIHARRLDATRDALNALSAGEKSNCAQEITFCN